MDSDRKVVSEEQTGESAQQVAGKYFWTFKAPYPFEPEGPREKSRMLKKAVQPDFAKAWSGQAKAQAQAVSAVASAEAEAYSST